MLAKPLRLGHFWAMNNRTVPLPRHLTHVLAALAALSVMGCSRAPALDTNITAAERAAPYPSLVPASQILAPAKATPRLEDDDDTALAARAAALRRRAAQLRATQIGG